MIPECVAAFGTSHAVATDYARTGIVASVSLTPETILDAVTVLDREGYLLEDVVASDLKEGFEITYHFSLFEGKSRIALRVIVPHSAPQVPSISGVYPGADWHERECFDFFGIDFSGHPNLHFLLLPEDFAGKRPLIKEDGARKALVDVMAQSAVAGPEAPDLQKTEKPDHNTPTGDGSSHVR